MLSSSLYTESASAPLHLRCKPPCPTHRHLPATKPLYYLAIAILRLDKVCKGLRLLVRVRVVMRMRIVRWTNVLHLVAAAALRTATQRATSADLATTTRQQGSRFCKYRQVCKGANCCLQSDSRAFVGTGCHGNGYGRGAEKHTVNHVVSCESAGQPVQPTYCSSPPDLTRMGSSRVPARSMLLV